jgi:GNAT superfamily N-acetyltransferase
VGRHLAARRGARQPRGVPRSVALIRPARLDEADALAEIQRRASVAAFAHIFEPERYPYPIDDVRRRWRDALAEGRSVFVYEEENEIVGVALTGPEWLDGLYVVPERWGRGVAAALHDAALEQARADGFERCHLWVLEENHRARRFYERRGWRLNERTRVVPYPPNPIDVSYTIDLETRLGAP